MKKNLITGLRLSLKYLGLIAAVFIVKIAIDIVAGRDATEYFSMPYYCVSLFGLVIAFACGFLFPIFLSKSMKSYTYKYPDVPRRYVEDICRGKISYIYCAILSCLCIVYSFQYDLDKYPFIVCALMAGGFALFFQYIKYRKKYKDL